MREPLDWQMFCRKETEYCKALFIGVNPHSNNFLKGKKKKFCWDASLSIL